MPTRDNLSFDPIAEAHRQWVAHGWEAAAAGMAAVTSLMRAQQIALARVEAVLRPHGVTFARYEVLMLLYFSRTGSLTMTRIGERLQVHPASPTPSTGSKQLGWSSAAPTRPIGAPPSSNFSTRGGNSPPKQPST